MTSRHRLKRDLITACALPPPTDFERLLLVLWCGAQIGVAGILVSLGLEPEVPIAASLSWRHPCLLSFAPLPKDQIHLGGTRFLRV